MFPTAQLNLRTDQNFLEKKLHPNGSHPCKLRILDLSLFAYYPRVSAFCLRDKNSGKTIAKIGFSQMLVLKTANLNLLNRFFEIREDVALRLEIILCLSHLKNLKSLTKEDGPQKISKKTSKDGERG